MDSNKKKKFCAWFVLPKKKRRKNKKRSSSTTSKRKSRSQDVTILFNHLLKDMKTLSSNDEAFYLSLMKIEEIINIIHSRKTPARRTYMQWDRYAISFYLKMCLCFGVDYQNLEATPKEEEDDDDDDDDRKKPEMPLNEQEERMESSGIELPPETKAMSLVESVKLLFAEDHDEEFLKEVENTRVKWFRLIRLTGPFEFGCYPSWTTVDRMPYHLYLLVQEAVDIMNTTTNDITDELELVEEKIRFFCKYFHSHLPNHWTYDRDNASAFIDGFDPTRKPRYLMSCYIPFEKYQLEVHHYDEETFLTPYEMADVMIIIHSRKMPSFWRMTPEEISFYCKLCSCFGIDYHRLEAASEDDVCLMKIGEKPR